MSRTTVQCTQASCGIPAEVAPGGTSATAQNCYGKSSSNYGLYADNAQNCYGYSTSSYGLYANYTAIASFGYSTSGTCGLYTKYASFCSAWRLGGAAIIANYANGCIAVAGTNIITAAKYNMP